MDTQAKPTKRQTQRSREAVAPVCVLRSTATLRNARLSGFNHERALCGPIHSAPQGATLHLHTHFEVEQFIGLLTKALRYTERTGDSYTIRVGGLDGASISAIQVDLKSEPDHPKFKRRKRERS